MRLLLKLRIFILCLYFLTFFLLLYILILVLDSELFARKSLIRRIDNIDRVFERIESRKNNNKINKRVERLKFEEREFRRIE